MTAKDLEGPHTTVVTPLREELAGKTHTTVVVMLAASAALLLIGCVNLANLLMSRGAVRGREVAVRTALGAGRGRLVAQFLTESLVLASVGAAAGLALAVPAMRLLEAVVPETMGPVRLTLDWRVLAFSAGVTIAAAADFRPRARAARHTRGAAGWTARRRTRHHERAQPVAPARAHRHANRARGGAPDDAAVCCCRRFNTCAARISGCRPRSC